MSERALASVKFISDIQPIPGADSIECATVEWGWQVVVRKGEFQIGDQALYLEIDSWVPYELAPFLCRGKEPREYNGVKGERLRTVRLRGQISQGLLLPVPQPDPAGDNDRLGVGTDLTEYLGIQKWERPLPGELNGISRGYFPSWLRKTDQDRVQNLANKIDWSARYEVSVKLDGSSMTLWFKEADEWGVCSRNVDLDLAQEGNRFVEMARKVRQQIQDRGTTPVNLAVQGELMGPGIQGNREGLITHKFFVFDIWDIEAQKHFTPEGVRAFCRTYGLCHVPTLDDALRLTDLGIDSVENALAFAEGPSLNNPVREGVVFKRCDGQGSFKAISNQFLLKEKD